jgi:hypothetical protein
MHKKAYNKSGKQQAASNEMFKNHLCLKNRKIIRDSMTLIKTEVVAGK